MARVQYGAIVTKIQGKVGGMTFQDNGFGNTLKFVGRVVYRVRSASTPGVSKRQMNLAVARASQRWYNLTQDQRNSWNNYALAYPQYARNSNTSSLSGYYVFMKRNLIAEFFDSFRLDEPDIVATPNPTFSPTLVKGVGTLLLTFNASVAPLGIDTWIFCSNWVKGDNIIRKGQTKFIQGYGWAGGDVDIYTAFISVFGKAPVAGDSIFLQLQNIGDLTGAVFARQTYRVLIS
jgi:hypothetical protein